MAHFVFPKWINALMPVIGAGAAVVPLYVIGLFWFGASPRTMNVGYQPEQPIPFSHRLHAGELAIDCRYCHNTVEVAARAAIPPTDTCMNCHNAITPNQGDPQRWVLGPLLESYETGMPIPWVRVHDLPEYSYFDHSAHVARGISCVSCHGRVDRMERVYQVAPLSMGWCLECHRDPAEHLRESEYIFDLAWRPVTEEQPVIGRRLAVENQINPSTDCYTCHR